MRLQLYEKQGIRKSYSQYLLNTEILLYSLLMIIETNEESGIPIYIRYLKLEDLDNFFQLNLPELEHNKFNAPYLRKQTRDELVEYVERLKRHLLAGRIDVLDQKKIIANQLPPPQEVVL